MVDVQGEARDPAGLYDGAVLGTAPDVVVHGDPWGARRGVSEPLQGCEQVAQVVARGGPGL